MTASNGNIFRVTGPLCGEFTGPGEFPTQRPVTRSFDIFFDLRLNKRLSKQPRGWWFETQSWSLWRHCNAMLRVNQLLSNQYLVVYFPSMGWWCHVSSHISVNIGVGNGLSPARRWPLCLVLNVLTHLPGQDGRHFTDIFFRCTFVNEKCCILITISLKFVLKGPIDNNPALFR